MDNQFATNFCYACYAIVDKATLTSVNYDPGCTMPIKFLFCPTCYSIMLSGDKEFNAEMWRRYELYLPHAEKKLVDSISQRFNVTIQR